MLGGHETTGKTVESPNIIFGYVLSEPNASPS